MNNSVKLEERPPHELLPGFIALLENRRSRTPSFGARVAFEEAIEEACGMILVMKVSEEHLPGMIHELKVVAAVAGSNDVQTNLLVLTDRLKDKLSASQAVTVDPSEATTATA